ncbi:c-type cytochrome [Hyphomicrobium sp.]|mgnify:CR=1 FL=1|uniref:c-type cytochrome n=1 Tax=Hyphomicrobium sp. TaxID=82 RepID=UPI002FDE62D5
MKAVVWHDKKDVRCGHVTAPAARNSKDAIITDTLGCRANAGFARGRSDVPVRAALPGKLLVTTFVLLMPLALSACSEATSRTEEPHAHAKSLMTKFGCGACHSIPGVADADGRVGPPLDGVADRIYLAGTLPNTPENMQRWLRDPQAVVAGNVMPNVGATAEEAQAMASYLATLHR